MRVFLSFISMLSPPYVFSQTPTDIAGINNEHRLYTPGEPGEAASSWDRPDVWKHQVVIYDPKQVKAAISSVREPFR